MCMYVFGVHVVSTKAFGVCEWKEHVVKRIPVSVLGMRVRVKCVSMRVRVKCVSMTVCLV